MADEDEVTVEDVTEVIDADDEVDEGEDLKLTLTLTWKEGPEYFASELPGLKSRAEEMAEYLTESFSDNPSDLSGLLEEHEGSYDVKVEPLPEGEI